jgi:endonuclease YncB( thermonuclease family)
MDELLARVRDCVTTGKAHSALWKKASSAWAGLEEGNRLCAAVGVGVCVGLGLAGAKGNVVKNSRRFLVADDIPAELFRQNAIIRGDVAKVTDGDTLRLHHTPKWSMFSSAVNPDLKLSESTLQVRLAAVECPETAKFGNPGQPGGKEATDFLRDLVDGKSVSVKLLGKDQYARIVGMATVGSWPFQKNLPLELLHAGHATIYRQGGAEYGGMLEAFEGAEQAAKAQQAGMWAGGKPVESAAEYKKRIKAGL